METDKNEQHLNLLSIFHYVVGGLTALFSCFPLIHIAIGIAMVCGKFECEGPSPPPAFIGYLFIILPAIMILFGWTISIAMIVTAVKLNRRRSRTFCMVVAAAECLLMPFGTILGVFTLIILMEESVKELFSAN